MYDLKVSFILNSNQQLPRYVSSIAKRKVPDIQLIDSSNSYQA